MSLTRRFGPFVLERIIGRGGMGAVFRAHREDNGQLAAVKALLLPLEQERERFSAEIETMKLLRHDNIVRLYGFGQEEGTLYYAMEYVDGPSLSTLLKRGRQFTWEEVVYIGASICRALKHAHDRGVIHRDIKPANILLLDDGVVKVSDYGIAQYFGCSRLTGAHQVVGTIEYMAPEQARAGAASFHTDMYSLGALLYALLTGKPPYSARDLTQLLQRFRQGHPESIRLTRPEIPQVVEEVVFDLLKINADRRPGDARVIGRRLEAILKTSPNCSDGNPFRGQVFSLDRKTETSSNGGSERLDFNDERVDSNEQSDLADIPYRSVSDEATEPPKTSPHDKTTEYASSVASKLPSQEELECRSADFKLAEEQTVGVNRESAQSATLTSEFVPISDELMLLVPPSSDGTTTAEQAVEEIQTDSDDSFALEEEKNIVPIEGMQTCSTDESTFELEPSAVANASVPIDKEFRARLTAETVFETVESCEIENTLGRVDSGEKKKRPSDELNKSDATDKTSGDAQEEPSENKTDDVEVVPLEKYKRSRFTPVDESELDKMPKTYDEGSTYMRLRIVCMLVVFFGIAFLFIDVFKTPSADKLYARIDKKLSECPSDELESNLRRVKDDLNRFLSLYPEDYRYRRVEYFSLLLETIELETRLERQIAGSGKIAFKSNVELPYVEACRVVLKDQEKGAEMLRSFIVLFSSNIEPLESVESVSFDDYVELFLRRMKKESEIEFDDGDSKAKKKDRKQKVRKGNLWTRWSGQAHVRTRQEQLIFLAKLRLEMVKRDVKKANLTDLALLNGRIELVLDKERFNRDRAEAVYNAAVGLYGECDWAQSVLLVFRERLDSMVENAPMEDANKEDVVNDVATDDTDEAQVDAVELIE